MRMTELLRLVFMNLAQNKFKVILTSVGIVVGSATIMLVLAIGTGGKVEVAEQFKNLNAGAIDISYEVNAMEFERGMGGNRGGMSGSVGFPGGGMPSAGGMPAGDFSGGGMPDFNGGGVPGFSGDERMNQEKIVLSEDDMEDLTVFVPNISDATISYTTSSDIEGGELEEASSYSIAGVKSNYMTISNMSMAIGEFLSEENDENKEKYIYPGDDKQNYHSTIAR